ncbi:Nramp family divalent metal transporter [Devriesea agamarum]|uniref:Nramp family divalent metal transporter n=1 Tax=Devriesea agamarum TaxID=472569 RepID=UPI00071E4FA4|nr:Nramp family divalent metal transporter [Devriesea agamarum]
MTETAAQSAVGRRPLPFLLGPAFVAAIAYVDPGNVAANITAGALYGYLLVWVLVAANLMAVLVQYLSASLGLVTGHSLPELLGQRLSKPSRLLFWGQAESVAAATDLAEIIGGAIALQILFGLPLVVGGVIVGLVSMALLVVQTRHGQRWFELVIGALLVVITLGFLSALLVSNVSWGAAAHGMIPRFSGSETVLLAASMLGATVMPHAIYAHSALVTDRHGRRRSAGLTRRLLRATRWDVGVSLLIAGSVNVAMLLVAAGSLAGTPGTDSIEGAHRAITAALGPGIGIAFGVGLLASGLASTSVGCYAGSAIMGGLLHRRIPIVLRRAITLVPALVLLGIGIDPTWALVVSQVVLSLGIPFALIPLVRMHSSPELMGEHVAGLGLRTVAWIVTGLIVALNIALVVLTFWPGAGS